MSRRQIRAILAIAWATFAAGCVQDPQNMPVRLVTDGPKTRVYLADKALSDGELEKIDAGERLGRSWIRIELPTGAHEVDLSQLSDAGFAQESPGPDTVRVDFHAGEPGLAGKLVLPDPDPRSVRFTVRYEGTKAIRGPQTANLTFESRNQ